MNSRERLLTALDRKRPDRLPATTHHVLDYFLDKYMDGKDTQDFFDSMGLDPICWVNDHRYTKEQEENWRIEEEKLYGHEYDTTRYYIHTPEKTLTMVMQSNPQTSWAVECLLKDKKRY